MCSPGCEMKIIDGPSASVYSLAFLLCALFMGILKAIKYDNSAISSRLKFPMTALNQSYFFILALFSPHGVHTDIDVLVHSVTVMRVSWSPLRWQWPKWTYMHVCVPRDASNLKQKISFIVFFMIIYIHLYFSFTLLIPMTMFCCIPAHTW